MLIEVEESAGHRKASCSPLVASHTCLCNGCAFAIGIGIMYGLEKVKRNLLYQV